MTNIFELDGNKKEKIFENVGLSERLPSSFIPITVINIEPAFSSHKPPLLYPNPAKEAVWIRTAGAEQLHIFDLSGKIILERKINQDELEIDTRTLSKGLYFVAVRSKTGIRSEKLLIE